MNQRVHNHCYGGSPQQAWKEEIAGHVRAGLHFWLMFSVRFSIELSEKLVWFFCDGTKFSQSFLEHGNVKANKILHIRLWASDFCGGYEKFLHEELLGRGAGGEEVCHIACYTIFIPTQTTTQYQVCILKGVKDILNLCQIVCRWNLSFPLTYYL